jgi:pseudouridine-5'-monophosphatase
MDGLLIDSEDIYTLTTNILLAENNRPPLPWSIKAKLQGRSGPKALEIFHDWAKLDMSHPEYLDRLSALQAQHFPSTLPLPGVPELLETLTKSKIHIALATSSNARNFGLKTAHLSEVFSYFPSSQKVLGDDPRIKPGRGKPAPDIYLLALETINKNLRAKGEREITPKECLVFEDAVPGVESGRRAGMRVIWCPHPGLLGEARGKEPEVLAGRCGDGEGVEGDLKVEGWPGIVGDGWAEQLKTLEDFDFAKYGINVPKSATTGND